MKIDYNYNKQILLVLNNIFLSVYYSIHIAKYSINIYETQAKAQKKATHGEIIRIILKLTVRKLKITMNNILKAVEQ